MNRDVLLQLVLGAPSEELPNPAKWHDHLEEDADNPNVWHVRATLGIGLRRVLVRNSVAPGPGVTPAWTTVTVAALMNLATDPDHRDKGYASGLIRKAHEETATHTLTDYIATFAPPSLSPFFERFGYRHPPGAPETFLVHELRADVPWPEGSVAVREPWWPPGCGAA